MSFLSDNKNFGLAMMVAGILMAIIAVVNIVLHFTLGVAITAVGSIIYGLMIVGVGSSTRKGEISQKLDILGKYVFVVGAGLIITSLFAAIGVAVEPGLVGVVAGIITVIISLIIGLIIIWISKKMTDGQVSTIDRVIWIILVIMFIISILGAIMQMLGGILAFLLGVCNLVIFLFLLSALFDPEVKKAMGMD